MNSPASRSTVLSSRSAKRGTPRMRSADGLRHGRDLTARARPCHLDHLPRAPRSCPRPPRAARRSAGAAPRRAARARSPRRPPTSPRSSLPTISSSSRRSSSNVRSPASPLLTGAPPRRWRRGRRSPARSRGGCPERRVAGIPQRRAARAHDGVAAREGCARRERLQARARVVEGDAPALEQQRRGRPGAAAGRARGARGRARARA